MNKKIVIIYIVANTLALISGLYGIMMFAGGYQGITFIMSFIFWSIILWIFNLIFFVEKFQNSSIPLIYIFILGFFLIVFYFLIPELAILLSALFFSFTLSQLFFLFYFLKKQ